MRVLVFLLGLISSAAFAAIDVYEFDSEQQEALFRELTQELRCPKCQNNNIADSNAGLAQDLREKTYQLVKQGNDKQQVLDYMVDRYGNFVRYDPPLTPAVLILWLSPLLVIVFGGIYLLGRNRNSSSNEPLVEEGERERLAKLIEQTERDKQ
ncbi:cytochrome c-type biogenesis protein [Aliagarivorans taiwanensis]|uniref:cytochrome c-type biogenesis protein n=1 Tax=Aliagarivorans taiwanensis TaxID=561966 RepID=UPI00041FED0E|nr:cytochrome c-type biogenesis protein [Aliagarivorans taiwanensis]